MKKAYLVLSNGKVFEGYKIGADAENVGEVVFTTGTVGYLETLTDPSYAGQIVVQTFPLIGNYGVIPEDFEGKCAVKGYIVRELCSFPSNFRSEYTLDEFLKNNNVCGLCGIDTRELTRTIREEGVMNGKISDSADISLDEIKNYKVTGEVARVSSPTSAVYESFGKEKFKVALLDYGAKANIIRCLTKRGCTVTSYPYNTAAEEILAGNPDGIMLSNGPGDPAENTYCIEQIKKLLGQKPLFGINQPVKSLIGTRTYITSQNHGYAVDFSSLENVGKEIFINANDGSCEGIEYPEFKAFTVQFHPEACGGPRDTEFLFDRFIKMMEEDKNA